MGFWEAIATCFRKYVNFIGRAARSEYWYFTLFNFLVSTGAQTIDFAILRPDVSTSQLAVGPVTGLFGLVFLLPGLAVSVRRFHDIDKSGWWLLIVFIPIVGWIIYLVWACRRGTPATNRFGHDPLGHLAPTVGGMRI